MSKLGESAIAKLAGRQYGVVSTRQLHAAGLDNAAIKRRCRARRLHRLHRGVYLVGHSVAPDGAAESAASAGAPPPGRAGGAARYHPFGSRAQDADTGAVRRAAAPEGERARGRVGRVEVDFLWQDQKVIVEVDGYAFHAGERAFERDRERDAKLIAHGYVVLRVTWRQLVAHRNAAVARLAAALALRS